MAQQAREATVTTNNLAFAAAGPLQFRPSSPYDQHLWEFTFTQNTDGSWTSTKATYAGRRIEGGLGIIEMKDNYVTYQIYGIVADPQDASWRFATPSTPHFSPSVPVPGHYLSNEGPVTISGKTYLAVGLPWP